MKRTVKYLPLFLFVLFLCSCATTIRYNRLKAATFNMANYRNILVATFHSNGAAAGSSFLSWKDFLRLSAYGSRGHIADIMTQYTSDEIINELMSTSYFTVIDPMVAYNSMSLYQKSQSIPELGANLGAQAALVVSLTRTYWNDRKFTETYYKTDEDGNRTPYKITKIERSFNLSINCSIVDTGTNALIATETYSKSSESIRDEEDQIYLPDPEDVFKRMVDSIVSHFVRQVAPYWVSESVTLAVDKSKNPLLEPAYEMVKNGLYDDAIIIFKDTWEKSRNPAAGFNLSVLYEVRGKLSESMNAIEDLITYDPSKKNLERKYRLEILIKEAIAVSSQY